MSDSLFNCLLSLLLFIIVIFFIVHAFFTFYHIIHVFLSAYKAQIDQFKEVPRYADVGVIFVDSDEMRTNMIPSPLACLHAIKTWLPQLAQVGICHCYYIYIYMLTASILLQ